MSGPPWLLLDVSYLSYRSYFALGRLSFGEIATTVVYGVLREVLTLQQQFGTSRVAFCFDFGKPLRCTLCPGYKSSRHTGKSEEELEAILEVKRQITCLRKDYLSQVGFRNLLFQKGYEADDIIAHVAQSRPDKEFIIVSNDHDLFQLLSPNVQIWNPHAKEMVTEKTFRRDWGLDPVDWIDVKAIAGCRTDDIPGVPRVGEPTAAKYLRGEMTKGKTFDAIRRAGELYRKNLRLVRLPFPNIEDIQLVKDEITGTGWDSLIKRLGMNSLAGDIPGIPRRKTRNHTKASLGLW